MEPIPSHTQLAEDERSSFYRKLRPIFNGAEFEAWRAEQPGPSRPHDVPLLGTTDSFTLRQCAKRALEAAAARISSGEATNADIDFVLGSCVDVDYLVRTTARKLVDESKIFEPAPRGTDMRPLQLLPAKDRAEEPASVCMQYPAHPGLQPLSSVRPVYSSTSSYTGPYGPPPYAGRGGLIAAYNAGAMRPPPLTYAGGLPSAAFIGGGGSLACRSSEMYEASPHAVGPPPRDAPFTSLSQKRSMGTNGLTDLNANAYASAAPTTVEPPAKVARTEAAEAVAGNGEGMGCAAEFAREPGCLFKTDTLDGPYEVPRVRAGAVDQVEDERNGRGFCTDGQLADSSVGVIA
jgi:hypothetical protein